MATTTSFCSTVFDYCIGFGQAQGEGLFRPDGLDTGVDHIVQNAGPVAGGGADADDIRAFRGQHLPVVGVDLAVGQAPAFAEDRALLRVKVGAGDQIDLRGRDIAGRMTVGQKDRAALRNFIIECAAHSSQTDNCSFVHE